MVTNTKKKSNKKKTSGRKKAKESATVIEDRKENSSAKIKELEKAVAEGLREKEEILGITVDLNKVEIEEEPFIEVKPKKPKGSTKEPYKPSWASECETTQASEPIKVETVTSDDDSIPSVIPGEALPEMVKKNKPKSMAEVLSGKTIDEENESFKKEVKEAERDASKKYDPMNRDKTTMDDIKEGFAVSDLKNTVMKVTTYARRAKDKKEIQSLILLMCICAVDIEYGKAYQKMMYKVEEESGIWEDGGGSLVSAAAIGCAILSKSTVDLPPALRRIKEEWLKQNGGYATVFTLKTILTPTEKGLLKEGMRSAMNDLTDTSLDALVKAVNKRCPDIEITKKGWFISFIIDTIKGAVSTMLGMTPEGLTTLLDSTAAVAREYSKYILAVIAFFSCALSSATKKEGQGFIVRVFEIWILMTDRLFIFLFGSREVYGTVLTTVGVCVSVYSADLNLYIMRGNMAQKEFLETLEPTLIRIFAGDKEIGEFPKEVNHDHRSAVDSDLGNSEKIPGSVPKAGMARNTKTSSVNFKSMNTSDTSAKFNRKTSFKKKVSSQETL